MRRRYPYRIEIYRQTRTPDGYGGFEEVDALQGRYWAKHYPKSGNENKEFEKVADTATTVFEIRNTSDIDETMYVLFRGKKYNIRYLHFTGVAREFLRIECERGVTL